MLVNSHAAIWLGLLCFLGFAFTTLLKRGRQSKNASQPKWPGPAQIPWVGRVHDLPIQHMWLKFKEWADMYGPVYRTQMLGTNWMIISDEKFAEEFLVKRAKIYSDRPEMKSLFSSKLKYLPLMGRNKFWAQERRFQHAYYTRASNAGYHGIMDFEVKRWLVRLLHEPENFYLTVDDLAAKIMCTLTWDDPSLSRQLSPSAWGLLTQMSPAGPLTNVLTPLWDYVPEPVNPWKLTERKRYNTQNAWWMDRLLESRSKLAKNHLRPCWTRNYLETVQSAQFDDDVQASCTIGMMAVVGVFTIAGPLYYFLVAMVLHPNWQRRIQEEVDAVCGDRMPCLADYPKLPILRSCIKETMRWRPNVPTGVAHELEEDDFWGDLHIPKGTPVLPLDFAFLRNPAKYPDPESFRPERWFEPGWPTYKEPLTQHPTIVGMSSFGWGRRTCLGQQITQDELLVACGSLLWAYNLKKKIDHAGHEIDIDPNKSNSLLIIKPDPFQMDFEPRSVERKECMVQQWNVAERQDMEARAQFLENAA